jgi:hypothetical protein
VRRAAAGHAPNRLATHRVDHTVQVLVLVAAGRFEHEVVFQFDQAAAFCSALMIKTPCGDGTEDDD